MNARATTPDSARPAEDARERLLRAGLRLFALQGFGSTSTRELAEAANVNVASISYYFGDKAGLYRAVFMEPLGAPGEAVARLRAAGPDLEALLQVFYAGYTEPLRQGDTAGLCLRLHIREMLEPSGLWQEMIAKDIRPLHEALVDWLCARYGLAEPDADLHRLVLSLAGLGVHLHVSQDLAAQVWPGLNEGEAALQTWQQRLVYFGKAMVEAEMQRRGRTAAEEGPR